MEIKKEYKLVCNSTCKECDRHVTIYGTVESSKEIGIMKDCLLKETPFYMPCKHKQNELDCRYFSELTGTPYLNKHKIKEYKWEVKYI